jgi:hypothetical protein
VSPTDMPAFTYLLPIATPPSPAPSPHQLHRISLDHLNPQLSRLRGDSVPAPLVPINKCTTPTACQPAIISTPLHPPPSMFSGATSKQSSTLPWPLQPHIRAHGMHVRTVLCDDTSKDHCTRPNKTLQLAEVQARRTWQPNCAPTASSPRPPPLPLQCCSTHKSSLPPHSAKGLPSLTFTSKLNPLHISIATPHPRRCKDTAPLLPQRKTPTSPTSQTFSSRFVLQPPT